jgi:microcystin-dependent protein
MACSNCFNGCADVISDQCVKYTGVDIPGLNIKTGDSLLLVENRLTNKILTLMDGSGVYPIINANDICTLVQTNLPCCPPPNLNQILTAYVKSICSIDSRVISLEQKMIIVQSELAALNADYDIPACLDDLDPTSSTHEVLQAVMDKLCSVETDLHSNYTPTAELDDLIAAHIAEQATTNPKNYLKMIPYVAYPYFFNKSGPGVDDFFDADGVGHGIWEKVYLCNGTSKSGIPDLRGRTLVGATDMGTTTMDTTVRPGVNGNPEYNLRSTFGANEVPLTNVNQMPSHNHIASIGNAGAHNHTVTAYIQSGSNDGSGGEAAGYFQPNTPTSSVGDHTHTITIENNGAGEPHANIQPSIGCNFIMHIP